MIASSSVTLRARSSRSACKSWNICKLTSYQRATRGPCEGGGVGGWRHQAESRGCSWLIPLPVPAGRYSGSVSTPTFDPCLKLTLPQASYSPWIPIIVSRIKTLSAKIFSASLIWCIPSPCEDRYSCQGKENKPRKLFAKMQDILFFSGHRSAVSGVKSVHRFPALRHIWSLYFSCGPSLSGHAASWNQPLPCWPDQHQHAHYTPASWRWRYTAGIQSEGFQHALCRHFSAAVTNVSLTGRMLKPNFCLSFVKVGVSDIMIHTFNIRTKET